MKNRRARRLGAPQVGFSGLVLLLKSPMSALIDGSGNRVVEYSYPSGCDTVITP
jgi:hypothetical protein